MNIASGAVAAPFRRVPPELHIYARSVSDDDLCAWCAWLIYDPGRNSLCQRHSGKDWPGVQDADGYCVDCPAWTACTA